MEAYVEPGTKVGPYVVRGELGRGVLGISLLAMDDAGDHFALKLLLPDKEFPKGQARIQMGLDFSALAELNLPEIPPVARFGRFGDHVMVVTQYFPDGNLETRLAESPLSRSGALVMIRHLAKSLGAVHDAGVAHGGIKPTNIVRRNFGGRVVPVLLDFGANLRAYRWAMFHEEDSDDWYSAPEVLAGEMATPASDVYSLGVLLATMLAGRGLTGPLQDVIAMATVDRLDWRYADANYFLKDLERALADQPTKAHAMITSAEEAMVAGQQAAEREAAERAAAERQAAERAEAERRSAERAAAEKSASERPETAPGSRASRRERRAAKRRDKGARGGRRRKSRMPLILLIGLVAATVAVTSMMLTKPDLGGKALPNGRGVEPGNRDGSKPGTPGVVVNAGYREVDFQLTRASGDSTVVQVNQDGVWEDAATATVAVPTVVGGQQACVEVRSADKSGAEPTYSRSIKLCGTSQPPVLKVAKNDTPCYFGGQRQICYSFAAEGFQSNSSPTLVFMVGSSVRGRFQVVLGSDGRGTLPKGTSLHFSPADNGKTAKLTLGDVTTTWTIESA